MSTTSGNREFFREGEYSTVVVHPWWKDEVKSPVSNKHSIRWRVQPLFEQYTTLLAEERSKRPFRFKEEEKKRLPECSIDLSVSNPDDDELRREWAKPHFYEKGSKGATHWRAITNLYPFLAPLWWIFLPAHSQDLNMVSRDDVRVGIDYAFRLTKVLGGEGHSVEVDEAEAFATGMNGLRAKVDGVQWGMNFGPKAGASIDHAHIQIGGIPRGTIGEADREIRICDSCGEDVVGSLIQAMKRDKGELVVKDLDGVLIYSPFAPKVSHQVNIVCEDRLPNLMSSTAQQRRGISEAVFLALRGLANLKVKGEKGRRVAARINNVNMVTKQTRFDNLESRYRLGFEILPRETTFGFSELSGFYVCDKSPEETAAELKKEIDRIG